MHGYVIHPSRWLSLFVLLLSVKVLAAPCTCERCGKELFCRTCDSGNSTSPPPGSSSCADEDLESSAAKNTTGATSSETPDPDEGYLLPYRFLTVEKDENNDALIVHVKVVRRIIDAIEREADAYKCVRVLAEQIASNLVDVANLRGLDHVNFKLDEGDRERLPKLFEMVEQKQKQMEFLKKMFLAARRAGAGAEWPIVINHPIHVMKSPIHERVETLTQERAAKIDSSQWPDLSDMGMFHLLTAEFQNASLMIDLTSVFQTIQEGNLIQLIITRMAVADGGNQAAASTVTPVMLAAIIPDAFTGCSLCSGDGQTDSTYIHLVWGTPTMDINEQNLPLPVRFKQHNLMNVLTAVMNVVSENEHNADLSLHLFTTPRTYVIQDDEYHPLCRLNLRDRINPGLPVSVIATDGGISQ
ncbi:hypothetical protein [Endozoicomonas sp. SESOKO4]|uniref:hypothetical protein n=1 Tax=Endozoicomonas sp. SESOKO4 TaxID=2828745 RepID=UPI00214932BC|nr:hypothetical protein [Endozoicomonas sp. SESOKO4]